jgi:isopentenyl phosphate kinase
VLTDKSSTVPKVETALLRTVAIELARTSVRPLVIVHGAGSYGHPLVQRTGLHRGLSDRESLLAMGGTQRALYQLCAEVTGALLAAGLPVFPVQASATALMTAGHLASIDFTGLQRLLSLGMIPVLYGVPAVDTIQGCSILSGDVIAAHVASALGIRLLIHATQTDGVFEADPTLDAKAERIPRINQHNWESIRPKLGGSAGVDVTGGMAGKVGTLLELAKGGLCSRIVSARIPGRIAAALEGQPVGTWVSWESL